MLLRVCKKHLSSFFLEKSRQNFFIDLLQDLRFLGHLSNRQEKIFDYFPIINQNFMHSRWHMVPRKQCNKCPCCIKCIFFKFVHVYFLPTRYNLQNRMEAFDDILVYTSYRCRNLRILKKSASGIAVICVTISGFRFIDYEP